MLRSLRDLERYKVSAVDGEVGSVVDFLWDDEQWTIRYLVVETGGFLIEHPVLIVPRGILGVDWSTQRIDLDLTMEKVEKSPDVDTHKSVSRHQEAALFKHYGYPHYWDYADVGGAEVLSALDMSDARPVDPGPPLAEDVHLHSANDVRGYDIQARDDSIGEVEDFIVDDAEWTIRYFVIDTKKWWFGKKVLVAPQWTSRISWEEQNVHIDLLRQTIKDGPEWDSSLGVSRAYEKELHEYFNRPAYWDADEHGEPFTRYSERRSQPSTGNFR